MTDLLLGVVALVLILASPHPVVGLICSGVLCVSVPMRMKVAERQAAARLKKAKGFRP